MYCEKNIRTGAKYRPGRAAAPERKMTRFRAVRKSSGAAVAAAVLAAALVLTGCGKKEEERFDSPLEYYRYVESAAIGNASESLGKAFDGAPEADTDVSGRKVGAEVELELFKPAADMLQTYTGMDFSWLKTLGLSAGMNLAEDAGTLELALALNGRELIGAEAMADLAHEVLYGRVPLLSEEYFKIDFSQLGLRLDEFSISVQQNNAPVTLPDGQVLEDLLNRCAEAALERVEDVKKGSDTLTAGGVSAKYTTLTVTLSEDDLRDMAEDVCGILRKDKDLEELILGLDEPYDAGLYDAFLDALGELPDRISLDDDIVMTLYVDGDDAIRGRVIEYGDYVLRYAMPEDGGKFALEMSLEDTDEDEVLWIIYGDGKRDGDTLEGAFTVEQNDTELFTIMLDRKDADGGMPIGTYTIRPTYEYYTLFGMYSLTARALEDFSYTLNVDKNKAAFEVYMDDEPFLALTVRAESGPAEDFPVIDSASDLNSWSMSLLLGGGLEKYLNYLAESDIPTDLLQQLLGAAF